LGGRTLDDESDVFTENAWDNVELDPEQLEHARAAFATQAQRECERSHTHTLFATQADRENKGTRFAFEPTCSL